MFVGLLILSYQSNCWQAGYVMGRGVMDLCWTCLETCLELPKSRYLITYIAIWWINSKVPEGSMITSENNSVARESSRVIILKTRLNSTGHSACTSKVRGISDYQTHVPNDWWQLMCSRVLQPSDRRNSMMAPVRNITSGAKRLVTNLKVWKFIDNNRYWQYRRKNKKFLRRVVQWCFFFKQWEIINRTDKQITIDKFAIMKYLNCFIFVLGAINDFILIICCLFCFMDCLIFAFSI